MTAEHQGFVSSELREEFPGLGLSWIVADRMPRALAGDLAPRAAARILTKDVSLAVDFAKRLGVPTACGDAARRAFEHVLAAGCGDDDDAVLVARAIANVR